MNQKKKEKHCVDYSCSKVHDNDFSMIPMMMIIIRSQVGLFACFSRLEDVVVVVVFCFIFLGFVCAFVCVFLFVFLGVCRLVMGMMHRDVPLCVCI
jgi:hypothetical protein